MPSPSVDEGLLAVREATEMAKDLNAHLVNLLDIAMKPDSSEESAAVDFAVMLFLQLGYAQRHRVSRTRKSIPLLICGEWCHAKSDVCLVDVTQRDILLLVQEDKRYQPDEEHEPLPQLIAGAIAAFEYNNRIRKTAGLDPLESKVHEPCVHYTLTADSY